MRLSVVVLRKTEKKHTIIIAALVAALASPALAAKDILMVVLEDTVGTPWLRVGLWPTTKAARDLRLQGAPHEAAMAASAKSWRRE